ncbi:MAG: alcohol dehydrogenase catalytic domain-containing protein [Deltaproteobacteria bacterium]|nr:alcohol dehydrogenase catalytic domain-containing protein [Deltaproteobacteria bacterium]
MKMQAVRWYGPEEIRIEAVEVPQAGPGEVLVKIGTALTCGTDFKTFRKGHALLVKEMPAPFGHELAGTVAEAGAGVTRFKKGDRVVTANSAPCDQCYFCQKQEFNLCENLQFLNGAYAEYIRIPAQVVRRNLYKIPDHLPFRDAALTEPLACVLHCFDRLALRPGEILCILGAGTCGLLFTQLAKLYGVKAIVVGKGQEKLNVAAQLGADQTVSVLDENFRKVVRRFSEAGYGPDVVVDAVGRSETWQLAVDLVRKGGRVWFYGGCAKGSQVTFDAHRLHYDEVSCFGVFHHTPDHFARALQLIADGKINVDALIRGEVRLSELHTVFRKGTSENPMKIAVIP